MIDHDHARRLADALSRRVHPNPSPAFIASVRNDAELMEMARTDMDAAAQMLIEWAVESVHAWAAAIRDTATTRKAA